MIFLVSTLVLFAVNNNCQEIITLQNETHLICVAKNKNSVMYTVPHIIGDTENTEVLLENDFWHHWTLNKSHDVPLAPVTDKRWEGFNTIHTDHYNISGSASFSIYFLNVPCGIRFKIYVDSGHYYISKTISDISWIHYTVNVVNGYVYIYENDRRLQVWRVNSNIPNVFIQTTCESTWKIHKYRVRVANKLSPAQVSLTIPPAISCLMFYVYLCPGCLLEIQASRNYSLQVKPDDTTKNGLFKSQEVLVEVNRNLNLVPQTLHGVKQTFWGIDIRKCPNIKLNKSIYEVQLSNNEREKNRTCEFLSPNSESPSRIAKVFPENQCEPGFLGQKCDLRCDELLGPEKTYCENHKICEKFSNNSICSCSWGFQEPLCVQPCMDGMWGLSCKRTCKHCQNCDKKTGECITASDDSYWFSIYFISLAVLISLIFIILILIRIMYKRRRRNKQPAIIQEVIMLTEDKKPLEDTVIDFDSLENRCLQPTFLTTLRTQFNLISGTVPHSSSRIGLQPENINKNKDRNRIIPFDLNRVILKPMEGVGTGDYINASYIDGYDRPKAYIACQSPKFYTVKDFWRMIWQQEVSVIIMATNFIECQKRMCAEYWPQRLSELYECGKIVVKLLKETTFEQYSHQELEVIYGNNVRTIHNFHLKWTINASSMFYPNNVLPIVKLIRQRYENSNGPIAVHSGYGTGRAGILILCDLALQMIKIDKKVDFFNLTKTLREQRPFIINKVECYLFVHLLVNEYFLEHRNPFQCTVGNNIKQQFKFVETLHQYDNIFQENSLQYCIPRLLFQSAVVARYGQTRKYLVSKGPKEDELVEFWKMVARQSVHCVLFLNKKFPLRVDITGSTEVVKLILTRVVNTTCGQMMEGSLLIYNRISREKYHDDNLYIFQFNNWKVNQLVPNSVDKFISVINHFRKVTAKEELALVSCSDGFTACGLFVVFSYIIEKYENEADIDVCNAIRNARRSGKLFLNRTRQLTFIYECIKNYREHHNKYEEIE
ncbi:receptor-type tyrosine-protein phosphatase epsilon-like isoform X7 [Zophobas morio]|uniref:receptor-type tyrosine-protein phosphatase epsilon-like isoform X7 n=1 Tax=Zophobas morio TaxID=2755281 RepID=UPI003083D41F